MQAAICIDNETSNKVLVVIQTDLVHFVQAISLLCTVSFWIKLIIIINSSTILVRIYRQDLNALTNSELNKNCFFSLWVALGYHLRVL